MQIPIYQVDAFTDKLFGGNPAAVCPLTHWPDAGLMQAIAAENNLSETAFLVPQGERYGLRWFTPVAEIDLCGHATLASAHIIFHYLAIHSERVEFETRSGLLIVSREGSQLAMDFPARPGQSCTAPEALLRGLGTTPREVFRSRDYLAVLDSEAQVRAVVPDPLALAELDATGVIITAPGDEVDFVSRFFAPREGIPEDPVTGSAHCTLVPYWSRRLCRTQLRGRQISARGGELLCEDLGERVKISGESVVYLEGTIRV